MLQQAQPISIEPPSELRDLQTLPGDVRVLQEAYQATELNIVELLLVVSLPSKGTRKMPIQSTSSKRNPPILWTAGESG